jgi:hypothetical protein
LARFLGCERKLNLRLRRWVRLNPFPRIPPRPVPELDLKARTI